MQYVFIFVPLAAFFIAYTQYDIYVATIILMIVTPLMLLAEYLKERTVKKMHLWVTVLLIVLGAITVLLRDPVFIQWKLTVVHWAFAALLFGSQWLGKTPLVQTMMEAAIEDAGTDDDDDVEINLTATQWQRFNAAWGLYFLFVGVLNLIIAYNFDEALWVKFKVFGIIALQLVFMIGARAWLFRHISPRRVEDATGSERAGE